MSSRAWKFGMTGVAAGAWITAATFYAFAQMGPGQGAMDGGTMGGDMHRQMMQRMMQGGSMNHHGMMGGMHGSATNGNGMQPRGGMHGGMNHHGMMGGISSPGQAAFGAIEEIVQKLEADPATDWSKVNIGALREHLIDMNEVTLRADAGSARSITASRSP